MSRPKPKRLRRGLKAGTGGTSSIPFMRDAPAGKSTVSMTEVVDMSLGSDISVFLMDILRFVDFLPKVADERMFTLLPGKVGAIGVEDADIGGVGLPVNGEPRPFDINPGLMGPIPGDGRPCESAGE